MSIHYADQIIVQGLPLIGDIWAVRGAITLFRGWMIGFLGIDTARITMASPSEATTGSLVDIGGRIWALSQYKMVFPSMGILLLKIRQSQKGLILIIPILVM